MFGRLLNRVLTISPQEVQFSTRGFNINSPAREQLELVGEKFLQGYHEALNAVDLMDLNSRLRQETDLWRGFVFEGAAMAMAFRDFFNPVRGKYFNQFLELAHDHTYMLHVGAGWFMARVPFKATRISNRLHQLYRWLAVDGYGFHEGYFRWKHYYATTQPPKHLNRYSAHAFFQGIGRSLWFIEGADPERINVVIKRFSSNYHGDLWSGIGLASAYAGGSSVQGVLDLWLLAGPHQLDMAQGMAFAAKARLKAGNLVEHTASTVKHCCGISAETAASITDLAEQRLSRPITESSYEQWRTNVRELLKGEVQKYEFTEKFNKK